MLLDFSLDTLMATNRTISRKQPQTSPGTPVNEDWGSSQPHALFSRADLDQEQEPEPEQTDVDRVMALVQSSGGIGRATVKVYKIVDGISNYCQSYTPSEFEEGDFSMLRDAFGHGRFKLMVYGEHPTHGNYGLLTRSEVTIAENRAVKSQAVQSGGIDPAMAQILQSIAQGQAQMLDALVSIKQTPARDPMEEMTKMLSMMSMMRGAMGLDAQAAQPKSQISEIVAAVRELRGVASEIMPERDDEGSNMMGMMPKVLEIIQAGVAQRAANPAPVAQLMQRVEMPASFAQAEQPQPLENPKMVNPFEIIKLKAQLSKIMAMAEAKAPAQDGADFLFEVIPDDFVEVLDSPNWLELLGSIEPRAAVHTDWLTLVRNLTLAMFDPAEVELTDKPDPSVIPPAL